MTNRRLGGEDRRVAPGGAGSSPAGSVWPKTNNKKTLRSMLRARDKLLVYWDHFNGGVFDLPWWFTGQVDIVRLDNERRLIRLKLKSLNKEHHENSR